MAQLASVKVTISGRVTGIGFRAFVRMQSAALGLTGYVRNVPGVNNVEVEAEGEKSALEKLIVHLKKGPPLARVEKVELNWSAYKGIYRDFSVRLDR